MKNIWPTYKLRKKSFTAPGQDFIQAEGFFIGHEGE
jgi:hypothetical protein